MTSIRNLAIVAVLFASHVSKAAEDTEPRFFFQNTNDPYWHNEGQLLPDGEFEPDNWVESPLGSERIESVTVADTTGVDEPTGNAVWNTSVLSIEDFSLGPLSLTASNPGASYLVQTGGRISKSSGPNALGGNYSIGNSENGSYVGPDPDRAVAYQYLLGNSGTTGFNSFHIAGSNAAFGKMHQQGGWVGVSSGANRIGRGGALGVYQLDHGTLDAGGIALGSDLSKNDTLLGTGVIEQNGGTLNVATEVDIDRGIVRLTGGTFDATGKTVKVGHAQDRGFALFSMELGQVEPLETTTIQKLNSSATGQIDISEGTLKVDEINSKGGFHLSGNGMLTINNVGSVFSQFVADGGVINLPAPVAKTMTLDGISRFSNVTFNVAPEDMADHIEVGANGLLIVDSSSQFNDLVDGDDKVVRSGQTIQLNHEVHGGGTFEDSIRLKSGARMVTTRHKRVVANGFLSQIDIGASIHGQFKIGETGSTNLLIFKDGSDEKEATFEGISDISKAITIGLSQVDVEVSPDSVLFVTPSQASLLATYNSSTTENKHDIGPTATSHLISIGRFAALVTFQFLWISDPAVSLFPHIPMACIWRMAFHSSRVRHQRRVTSIWVLMGAYAFLVATYRESEERF